MADSEELNSMLKPYKRELQFKFVFLGDYGVGKTSIIKRYSEGLYSNTYKITIGADFAIRKLDWEEYDLTIQLWDIAGHERFGCLTSVYYRYAVAAAVVFDLTRPETFISIDKWLQDLHTKASLPKGQKLPVILLANKGDINLSTIPHNISSFCLEHNILKWFITSAKDNTNIDEAMYNLVKEVVENYETEKYIDNNSISLTNKPDLKEEWKLSNCCR